MSFSVQTSHNVYLIHSFCKDFWGWSLNAEGFLTDILHFLSIFNAGVPQGSMFGPMLFISYDKTEDVMTAEFVVAHIFQH